MPVDPTMMTKSWWVEEKFSKVIELYLSKAEEAKQSVASFEGKEGGGREGSGCHIELCLKKGYDVR